MTPEGKILNPVTGRYVMRNGKLGRALAGSGAKPKKCPDHQVLNPATKRCVSKTGKIGKDILGRGGSSKKKASPGKKASPEKKASGGAQKGIRAVYDTMAELIQEESRGGVKLGEGREGVVFELPGDKVCKISYSNKAVFGPQQLKRAQTEARLATEVGKARIGPIVYTSYFVAARHPPRQAFVLVMEKVDLPPTIGPMVCAASQQRALVDSYRRLSKLKISTNDYNIANIMFKRSPSANKLGKWMLIDMGRAKIYKTEKLAWETNLSVLIGLLRPLSGSGVQAVVRNTWRCPNLDAFIEEIIDAVVETKSGHLAKYLATHANLAKKIASPAVVERMKNVKAPA